MTEAAEKKKNMFVKSSDTEEWLDTVFTRPIGLMWAKFFNLFGAHPNVITILSIIFGAASGWFFHYDADTRHGLLYNIIGVILLMWANFYDSADGQLARMTGKKSRLGRILDGAAGDIWFISIYLALLFRMWSHIDYSDNNGYIIALVIFAVVAFDSLWCHARQCGLADYYRNIHLFFLKGKNGSELDNYLQQKQNYENTSWRTDFIEKFFLWFYVRYTRSQEAQTPQFQQMMQTISKVYDSNIPESLRAQFRTKSLPLMKYTNILTFNTRAIALYISCLIDLPWLYIVFELFVMTALYFYMRRRHETMCMQFTQKILTNHEQ